MFEFVIEHQFWTAVAIYWIFSAAVSSMPDPSANGGPGYFWLYRFLHTIAGNLTTAFGAKIPGIKAVVAGLLLPLILSATACAAHYNIHPGALNPTDSAAYDILRIAEAAIDEARLQNQAQPLPTDVKDALNVLVDSYNVARDAWLTYRGAVAAERKRGSAQPQGNATPSDQYFQQLTRNLTDLTNALEALKRREVKQ